MMRIRFRSRATEQIREADAWWREHRTHTELLRQELLRALSLLRETPHVGARDSHWPNVRRFYLRRVGYFIYNRIGDEYVDVLAFWHEARGASPRGRSS
jgi:plasmid stabilization system protein ParE